TPEHTVSSPAQPVSPSVMAVAVQTARAGPPPASFKRITISSSSRTTAAPSSNLLVTSGQDSHRLDDGAGSGPGVGSTPMAPNTPTKRFGGAEADGAPINDAGPCYPGGHVSMCWPGP